MRDLPKLNGSKDQRTVATMNQRFPKVSQTFVATCKVAIAVFLLVLTVPWWPGLDGQVGGLPSWAVYSVTAALIYALIVAWLLQRHWDDGAADDTPEAPSSPG